MTKHRSKFDEGPAAVKALSRRKFLTVSAASAAFAGTAALSGCVTGTQARTPGTTPKSVARYRNAPNQGRRCAQCAYFLAPDRCAIVAGGISPNGWCSFYRRRRARMQDGGSSGGKSY